MTRKRPRRTKRVLDRRGRPALMVTTKELREHGGYVLRRANQRGAVAISKNGKPIAVALALDQFVNLCIAYATAAIRRNRYP